ncbi:MAG: 2Fe-2S iron-sulfur cluster-binding protein [Planctomycetota bacterium]
MVQVPCIVRFKRSGLEVEAPAGATLLEVAEEQGITLSSLCRGGTCGTCKARLISGQPRIDTLYALNAHQRAAGWILTCSARTVAGQRIVLDL